MGRKSLLNEGTLKMTQQDLKEVVIFVHDFNAKRYNFWLSLVKNFNGLKPDICFLNAKRRKDLDDEKGCAWSFFAKEGEVIFYGFTDTRQNYHSRHWAIVDDTHLLNKEFDKRKARKVIQERNSKKEVA